MLVITTDNDSAFVTDAGFYVSILDKAVAYLVNEYDCVMIDGKPAFKVLYTFDASNTDSQ